MKRPSRAETSTHVYKSNDAVHGRDFRDSRDRRARDPVAFVGQNRDFSDAGVHALREFDNISGLKTGDQVQLAGVQIGKVAGIMLKNERARIAMRVNDGVQIDADAIAAIKTSGIIGDKYLSIALGPSDRMLKDGDTIRQTQSAFVLEDAIGQLINSSASNGNGNR